MFVFDGKLVCSLNVKQNTRIKSSTKVYLCRQLNQHGASYL